MDLANPDHYWRPIRSRITLVSVNNSLRTPSILINLRWLVRRGRTDDAKKALLSLTSAKNADVSFNVDQTIAMMVTTNELEKALESGTGYLDCFKGIDLRRTEIVCVTYVAYFLLLLSWSSFEYPTSFPFSATLAHLLRTKQVLTRF